MWMLEFIFSKGHSESCEALGKYLWTDSNKDLSLATAHDVSSETRMARVTRGGGALRRCRQKGFEGEGAGDGGVVFCCSGLQGQ